MKDIKDDKKVIKKVIESAGQLEPGDSAVHASARALGPSARPLVDIYESDDDYMLVAEIPGANESDIDLTLEEEQLTIRAPRHLAAPGSGGTVLRDELGDLVWERTFQVGRTIDAEGVTATLENGVLGVRLPKAAAAKPRRIEVFAAG